ncbi:MAG: FtsQ-type POTRA domain-containing protein [Tenericutes bacterium]|nr:FtsQ-type POTRA domain-containing protein [Mycoplasmatota bacterium]MDD7630293.1 FtsQ-type POTRA domain-containing protein [bacterium]MDY4108355.1 FtsQ-type POTRA domain-containing protein [Bacilli bacterium]
MEEEKVVKKFSFVKLVLVLLIMYIIGFLCYKVAISRITNIYIKNNNILTDQEVIDASGLRNYPSFILTTNYSIKNKLLKNDLVKKVKVKKGLWGKVYIDIEEYKPLFIYEDKVILDNKNEVDLDISLPILVNKVDDDILDKLISKYESINDEIKLMISEIKYDPNDIDKERFLFTMSDGNYVYITLYKLSSIDEYLKITSTLKDKKGILYLDSGNYFEVFK